MKKEIIKYFKIFLIIIFLEVILFNITSFRTFFGNYEIKEFYEKDFEIVTSEEIQFGGRQANKAEKENTGIAKIKIDNIGFEVATIKLELYPINGSFEYYYYYSDNTTSGYMGLPAKVYIHENTNSHYIPCYLSGNVNSLILNIDENIQKAGIIEKIVINEKIPFDFNFARVLILFGIVIIFDFFKNSEIMKKCYDKTDLKQEKILLVVLGFFIFLVVFINFNANDYKQLDMYNYGLVESLADGSLYLKQEPSEEFKNLENPYDFITRENPPIIRGRDFVWDSAYYNGKFYVYFGILPAIMIFLPYFLITGKYLQTSFVCLGVSVIILILLKEILCKFIKRYFEELPFKLVVLFLITLFAGSMILYMNGAARVYELLILSGVCFVLAGILCVLKSMEEPEKRYRYIFLSCFFMALSVACRPTNLLASIIILPYLLKVFIEDMKNFGQDKKSLIKCVFSIGIPYIIVAIPLMWYNYARFESIFEFGANYQLTINNIGALKSGIYAIPTGLICNLFSIPKFITTFPFVQNYSETMTFYGFYFVENMLGGLFMIAPICFFCFNVFKISKYTENKELKIWIYSFIVTGIIIASISAAKAGSIQRYLFDYGWMFLLSGILIFAIIYQNLKSEESKKIMFKILCGMTIYIVIINILIGIVSEQSFFQVHAPEIFYKMKYSIMFWE